MSFKYEQSLYNPDSVHSTDSAGYEERLSDYSKLLIKNLLRRFLFSYECVTKNDKSKFLNLFIQFLFITI